MNAAPQLLNLEMAAGQLAISPHTVRKWVKDGKLHPLRLYRRLRFHPDEIARLIAESTERSCRLSVAPTPLKSHLIGPPLGVIDATNNTGTYSDGVRPELTGNPNSLSQSRPRAVKINAWFDTTAFTQNAAYTFGNAPRTFGRGPGLITSDLTLLKRVALHEQQGIEFRLEAFNAFNHANLGNPSTTFGNANFGKISTLQSGTTGSRTLQLAAHYTF
jgi:hypothetical protein